MKLVNHLSFVWSIAFIYYFHVNNFVESAKYLATFPSIVHADTKPALCIQVFDISQNVEVKVSSPQNAFSSMTEKIEPGKYFK